jgi:hypothetical protein
MAKKKASRKDAKQEHETDKVVKTVHEVDTTVTAVDAAVSASLSASGSSSKSTRSHSPIPTMTTTPTMSAKSSAVVDTRPLKETVNATALACACAFNVLFLTHSLLDYSAHVWGTAVAKRM